MFEKNNRPEENPMLASLESLKASLTNAPVFAFVERFDTFLSKKKRVLHDKAVLFEPGENPYLYIVASGALGIFRINPSGEKKEVGRVYTGGFIGEGVLSGRNTKDVEAVSITEHSEVIVLTQEDIEFLETQSPETLAQLYKHINNVTSLRLAEAGRELAIMYESTQKFQEYRERGARGLLDAINHMKDSLKLENIIAIEKHPLVPNLHIYKYNTNFPTVWPIHQKVDDAIELKEWVYQGPEILWTKSSDSIYILTLQSGQKTVGHLVAVRPSDNPLNDSDLRVMQHIAPQLASMMEHIQQVQDTKAREMSGQV